MTGYRNIDNKRYYFDEKAGYAITGFKTVAFSDGEYTYYFDGKNGALTGLQTIDGKTYYFSGAGAMLTGLQNINDKYYYFDEENGQAYKGFKQLSDGYVYYFDGKNGAKTGLQKIENDTYYFSDIGKMQTGLTRIDGKRYYFDLKTGKI